jgi:hypothetical protein
VPDPEKLKRELPLDGLSVTAGGRTWTIELNAVTDDAPNSTVRTAVMILRGNPDCQLTLKVPGEKLVVEHREGDVGWILDVIRDWLNDYREKGPTTTLVVN